MSSHQLKRAFKSSQVFFLARAQRVRPAWPLFHPHARQQSTGPALSQSPFWTTGRVSLLTALTASIFFTAGTNAFSARTSKSQDAVMEPSYASQADMEIALSEIRQALGPEYVSTDADELHNHGYSDWSSINSDQLPVAIAYPSSTSDVSLIAKICHKHRVPIVPYSGGSSLEGNFSSPFGGLNLDFAHMDQILDLHAEDMDVVVQPSVPWMSLNEEIKDSGLFFPVDPGPSAQIGGMVGTGGSGTNAVRYGTMRDWVINLTVVLADGTVIKTRRRPRKSSAGYNLTQLFVGSEGTLAIVTEITLKLAVIPQETSVAVVTFPTIRDAAAAASKIMRAGVPVAAVEIMDEVQMNVVNRSGCTKKKYKEIPTLFFKFSGTPAGVADNISMVRSLARASNSQSFDSTSDPTEAADLWSARKNALWSMLAMKRNERDVVWSTDVAVPFSRLPDLIEVTKKDLDGLSLFASALGHVGDGNFHTSILYDRGNEVERERVEGVVHRMVERAIEMEGTCTGEHGIGIGKKEQLIDELGPETVNVMKEIKRSLDDRWILNPGKIFDH